MPSLISILLGLASLSPLLALPNPASNLNTRATLQLPSGWSYIGCLYEGIGQRIMTNDFQFLEEMTASLCVQYCITKGTPYAAIEVGDQCFCGSTLDYVQPMSEAKCDYKCAGDEEQMCGGYGYMTFFSKTDKDPRIAAGLIPSPTSSTRAPTSTTTTQPIQTPSSRPMVVSTVITTSLAITPNPGVSSEVVSVPASDSPIPSPSATVVTDSNGSTSQATVTVTLDPSGSGNNSTSVNPALYTLRPGNTTSSMTQVLSPPLLPSPATVMGAQSSDQADPRFREGSQYIVFGTYASESARSVAISNPILLLSPLLFFVFYITWS